MKTLIRPAKEDDFKEWLPLWLGYNRFYGRYDHTALPEVITKRTWGRFFDLEEPMHCIVAELDGKLVGLVHFIFHRTTVSIAPSCYLQDLFTEDSVRGQGIGRALIEAVSERAREAGSARLYWLTQEANATARRLYDQVAELSEFVVYRKPLK